MTGRARYRNGCYARDQRDGSGRGYATSQPSLRRSGSGDICESQGFGGELVDDDDGGGRITPAVLPLIKRATAALHVRDEHRVARNGGPGLGCRERLLGEMCPLREFS